MAKTETEQNKNLFIETYKIGDLTMEAICYEEAVKDYYDEPSSSDSQVVIQDLLIHHPLETISLKSLLPSGWKLVDAGRSMESDFRGPRARRENKTVYLPLTPSVYYKFEYQFPGIDATGMRLGSLHEIVGHAAVYDLISNEDDKRLRVTVWLRNTALQRDLTPEEIEEYNDVFIADERNAWSAALNFYRNLLNQGINIEPEMTAKEVVTFAHGFLESFAIENYYKIRRERLRA